MPVKIEEIEDRIRFLKRKITAIEGGINELERIKEKMLLEEGYKESAEENAKVAEEMEPHIEDLEKPGKKKKIKDTSRMGRPSKRDRYIGEVVKLSKTLSSREISEELFKKHKVRISANTISYWLRVLGKTGKRRGRRSSVEGMKCPRCGSTKVKKKGFGIRGVEKIQKYMCNGCNRSFYSDTKKKLPGKQRKPIPENVKCPCGSRNLIRGGVSKRKSGDVPKYKCKDCGRAFIAAKKIKSGRGVVRGVTKKSVEKVSPQKLVKEPKKIIKPRGKFADFKEKHMDEIKDLYINQGLSAAKVSAEMFKKYGVEIPSLTLYGWVKGEGAEIRKKVKQKQIEEKKKKTLEESQELMKRAFELFDDDKDTIEVADELKIKPGIAGMYWKYWKYWNKKKKKEREIKIEEAKEIKEEVVDNQLNDDDWDSDDPGFSD